MRAGAVACLAGGVAAVSACDHSAGWAARSFGTDVPLVPGNPARLTWNPNADHDPAWLPDGRGLMYTADTSTAGSTCLGILPPTGGRATWTWCRASRNDLDSVDAVSRASVSPSGRLVYLHQGKTRVQLSWGMGELVLASLDDPAHGVRIYGVPQAGVLPPHNGMTTPQWLDDRRFVYRADVDSSVRDCQSCPLVVRSVGLYVMLVDLGPTPPSFTMVPGTLGASSVGTDGPDGIVYTLYADSTHIFRRTLSTGDTTTLWDFGANVAPRDVQRAGSRLVAVAAGRLVLLDPADGTSQELAALPYGPLALAPDGRRLAAALGGDLWLFEVP